MANPAIQTPPRRVSLKSSGAASTRFVQRRYARKENWRKDGSLLQPSEELFLHLPGRNSGKLWKRTQAARMAAGHLMSLDLAPLRPEVNTAPGWKYSTIQPNKAKLCCTVPDLFWDLVGNEEPLNMILILSKRIVY